MRPLTLETPKPLLAAAGKPLIVWHIERLVKAGFKTIVINHSWLGEKLEQAIGHGERWGISIYWSPEEALLETGGGILHALPLIGESPFLVVNGDVFTDLDFTSLSLADDMLAHLVLVDNPVHNPEGDFSLKGRLVQGRGDNRLTFSGVSILHPKLFEKEQPGVFPLAPLLVQAMNQELVTGESYQGYWLDVGTPERLHTLEEDLLSGRCGR